MMIALPKDAATIMISHTRKNIAGILSKSFDIKIGEVIEEDQLGFRRDKATRHDICLTRIIAQRVLDGKNEMFEFLRLAKGF